MRRDRVQVDDLPKKDDLGWTHALRKRSNRSVNGGPEMTGDLAKIEEPPAVRFRKILNERRGGNATRRQRRLVSFRQEIRK